MTLIGRPPSCNCGSCQKCKKRIYMRGWYARKSLDERRAMIARRDRERVRAYDRTRTRNPQYRYNDDPVKRRARIAVSNAVRAGRIVRQPCSRCGTTLRVHAHHPDYSRPLSVWWLCAVHHAEEHARMAA